MPTKQDNKTLLNRIMGNQQKKKEERNTDNRGKGKEMVPSFSSSRNTDKKTQNKKSNAKQKWKEFLHSDTNTTQKVCGICLEIYNAGDDLCFSHNNECDHVFHKNCIMSWLIQHDDCPNCRATFIVSTIDV